MKITYVMCSIFRSILASRRKCRSCTDHEQCTVRRKSIVRTVSQSIQHCSGNDQSRKCHSVHNRDCRLLESSRVQSSGDRKHKSQSPDRSDHDPNSQADIYTPVGREFRSHLLASRPCRSIDRTHSFRVRSTTDLDSRLLEQINYFKK